MSKETQQLFVVFVALFSACSFATHMVSLVGKRWYSCHSEQHSNDFDIIFSLWSCCQKNNHNTYDCHSIDDMEKLKDVILDFRILRGLGITAAVVGGLTFILAILHFVLQGKKVARKLVIIQACTAIITVVFGLSNLVYSALRGQDIVGLDTKFTFGWSCVIGWIATIIAMLNTILTVVLLFIFLDNLTERSIQVREELNMDNLSISSETLNTLANGEENVTADDTISNNRTMEMQATQEISSTVEDTEIHDKSTESDAKKNELAEYSDEQRTYVEPMNTEEDNETSLEGKSKVQI